MATLSSHTLNSLDGTHAGGIAVAVIRINGDGSRTTILESATDTGGRFSEKIDLGAGDTACDFEMVLDTAAYFAARGQQTRTSQILRQVVIRFVMPDADGKYHIPLMLAPNSYSVWWSS